MNMIQATVPKKAGPLQAWVIIVVNILPMMGIVALMPVVPSLLEHFKNTPHIQTLAPLILAAPGLCIALLAPFAGYLTDKWGRRKLLIRLMMFYGVGGVLPFFIDDFWTLMGGRFLLGIGEAFIITIVNALLGDYFSPKERAKWLMMQGIFASIFGTLMLSGSGHLAAIGWQYPFLLYSLAFLFAILAWLFIFEPDYKTATPGISQTPSDKPPYSIFTMIFIITFILSIIYFVYTLHFSLALDEMGIKDKVLLGNLSAIASIGVPIGGIIFKLISKRPFWQQCLVIAALLGIGLTGIGMAGSQYSVVVFAFIQQLGCGTTIPVLVAWALNTLPLAYRGRGMGIWSSALFLGQFSCPLVVSLVREWRGGLLPAFTAFGMLCLLSALVIFLLGIVRKKSALAT